MLIGLISLGHTLAYSSSTNNSNELLKQLLNSLTDYEEQWRLTVYYISRNNGDAKLLIKQPLHEGYVIALLYDKDAENKSDIPVAVYSGYYDVESRTRKYGDQPEIHILKRMQGYASESAVFMGKIPIQGSHGTLVKVEYKADSSNEIKTSDETSMAFH